MYARKHEQQELNFVVSGKLWNRSLVMQDLETKSLWSHILGKAMQGKLKDVQLETLPSVITDWGTWKKLHPNTTATLLSRTARIFENRYYLDLRKFVIGLASGTKAKAWRYTDLEQFKLLNDYFDSKPLVILFDETTATPFVFESAVGNERLVFQKLDENFVDQKTGSHWDLRRGVAIEGELSGTQLKLLPAIPSFYHAWRKFHPNSEYGSQEASKGDADN